MFPLQKKYQDVFSGQNLFDLQPDTTYCLEVKACLENRKAFWSPEYCIKTPKGMDLLFSLFFSITTQINSATLINFFTQLVYLLVK